MRSSIRNIVRRKHIRFLFFVGEGCLVCDMEIRAMFSIWNVGGVAFYLQECISLS